MYDFQLNFGVTVKLSSVINIMCNQYLHDLPVCNIPCQLYTCALKKK